LRNHLKRHLSELPEGVDEGFTLIELLVVLLILGILLAIAIPTFLTVTKSATNTAVTSNLQTALTGANTYYTENSGSYTLMLTTTNNTVSDLAQQGTGLTYLTGTSVLTAAPSTGTKYINVYADTLGQDVVLTAWNGAARCYVIADAKTTGGLTAMLSTATSVGPIGTYYGWYPATGNVGANCTGSQALTSVGAYVAGATSTTGAWSTSGGFPS
jgi:type IV pilus assembly protein PilA